MISSDVQYQIFFSTCTIIFAFIMMYLVGGSGNMERIIQFSSEKSGWLGLQGGLI